MHVAAPVSPETLTEHSGGFSLSLGNFDGPFDLLLSLISIPIVTFTWVLIGYSIAFSPGTNKGWGDASWGAVTYVGGGAGGVV